jgi:hypothetical protein
MKIKSIFILTALSIIVFALFQGCTVGGYMGGKIEDLELAPVIEKCSLYDISEGDYIEFLLKNDNIVRGKVKDLESDKHFVINYFPEDERLKKTTLLWQNIQAAHRLEVGIQRRCIGMSYGCTFDSVFAVIVYFTFFLRDFVLFTS